MPRRGSRPKPDGPRPGIGQAPDKTLLPLIAQFVRCDGMTPLEYMLSVMNDPDADPDRRDRMAQAAAPYMHPKAERPRADASEQGKKELAREAARTAERGTGWEGLLGIDRPEPVVARVS